jgi:hypothetical protein
MVAQEIPLHLLDLKVHYRVHNSPPLTTTLSDINPVRTLPPDLYEVKL